MQEKGEKKDVAESEVRLHYESDSNSCMSTEIEAANVTKPNNEAAKDLSAAPSPAISSKHQELIELQKKSVEVDHLTKEYESSLLRLRTNTRRHVF